MLHQRADVVIVASSPAVVGIGFVCVAAASLRTLNDEAALDQPFDAAYASYGVSGRSPDRTRRAATYKCALTGFVEGLRYGCIGTIKPFLRRPLPLYLGGRKRSAVCGVVAC